MENDIPTFEPNVIFHCKCGEKHEVAVGLVDPLTCWPRPIPVEERLPESGVRVIGLCSDDHYANYWHECWYTPVDGWKDDLSSTPWNRNLTVTRWLPMPPDPE